MSLGELSPSGESVYLAQAGQPGVLLAPAQLRGALAKTALELRDKTVLDFPLEQVRRLELTLAGQTLTLERAPDHGGWLLGPGQAADPAEVENLLLQAHGLLAQGFLDKDIKPSRLGLEPPQGRLSLTLDDGSQRGLVWGGAAPGQNQAHARRLEGGPVFVVRGQSLARLERRRFDLLDRRLFSLTEAAVARLSLLGPGVERIYARQQGQWQRLRPPGNQDDGLAGQGLLADLLDLRWEKPLPAGDYGLQSPVLTISLTPAEGQGPGQALQIGKIDPQTGLLAAQLTGRTEIYGIKSSFLGTISQQIGAPPPALGDKAH